MPHGLGGVWMGVIVGVFSFYGIEVIAVTSGEAKDPRVAIPAALRTMLLRLFLFYVLGLGIIVTLVPWTSTGAKVVSESPFVRVFANSGIAHAAGIMLDEITTTWDKWVTPNERKTAKGVIPPGHVAAVRFTINGVYQGQTRIQLEHVNRIGLDAAPDWPAGTKDDVYRVDIEGTPSISQETAFRFTDGSGRDAAAAGCLATGMRALNAVPAVNELSPGWVTPLDLPLIPGVGTIR